MYWGTAGAGGKIDCGDVRAPAEASASPTTLAAGAGVNDILATGACAGAGAGREADGAGAFTGGMNSKAAWALASGIDKTAIKKPARVNEDVTFDTPDI